MSLVTISRALARAVDALTFAPPVAYVYNPLQYARAPHEDYLRRFGELGAKTLLLGMNPGPWGMAQTGVPFGDVAMVKDWMGIEARVGAPAVVHPKRPIEGFACPRSEVSGTRLWSWAAERFGTPASFFARFFVWNHCPLAFLEASGRNRTPDKLPKDERDGLLALCDDALAEVVDTLGVTATIGIGSYAEARLRRALGDRGLFIGRVLHPSPASPAANRGWAEAMDASMRSFGLL